MEAVIYNSENGATIAEPLEEIDVGGFVVINWRDIKLMLPRTFNADEISFTDGKIWWSYGNDSANSLLRIRKGFQGDIEDFKCIPIEKNL